MTTGVCFHPNSLEIPAPTASTNFSLSSSDENLNWASSTSALGRSVKSARRNLFGKVNTLEALGVVKKEMERIQEQQSKKYNFDFENEKPLPGRYKWIPVVPGQEGDNFEPLEKPNLDSDQMSRRGLSKDEEGKMSSQDPSPCWSTSHIEPCAENSGLTCPLSSNPLAKGRNCSPTLQSPLIPAIKRGKTQSITHFVPVSKPKRFKRLAV